MTGRLLVVAAATLATACGGTWTELANGTHPLVVAAREEMEHGRQEERKRQTQHESICFDGRSARLLDLFYNFYSVKERPQLLLPLLERDLIKNRVESGNLYREDADLRAALTGQESLGRSFVRDMLARAQEDRLALFDTRGEFVAARDAAVSGEVHLSDFIDNEVADQSFHLKEPA